MSSYDLGLRRAQAISTDRANRWHRDVPWSMSDWFTAFVGEVGETGNVIKKLNRHRDGIATDRDLPVAELRSQLEAELADVLAYLLPLASEAGVDLAGAFIDKFNTVSGRQGWDDLKIDPLVPRRTRIVELERVDGVVVGRSDEAEQ